MTEENNKTPEVLDEEQLDLVTGGGQPQVFPKSEEKDR